MITICLQCHHFQRRLCWMLASLLDQDERDFRVDVACFVGNGSPSTERVVDYFARLGLRVTVRRYRDYDRFERRGLVRNDQLAGCTTPWVWFADADHVYHPRFLARLRRELAQRTGETRVLSAGRMSTPSGGASQLVEATVGPEPVYVGRAFERAQRLEPLKRMRCCGAGHTQIVRTDGPHGGLYVPPDRCRDWPWSRRYQKARSDIQFRRRCGGSVGLPEWFTRHQFHLNHPRDSDRGVHLRAQR